MSALTRRLREHGTMQGWLYPEEMGLDEAKKKARAIEMHDEVFRSVSPNEPIHYKGGDLRLLVVDAGVKDNIVRSLLERGASVIRAPYHARLAELALGADGILIGNGPGDPKDLKPLIDQVRMLLGSYRRPTIHAYLSSLPIAVLRCRPRSRPSPRSISST